MGLLNRRNVSDNYADGFFLIAVVALIVNFLSQPLAMPIQGILVLIAIYKCNIKLIPAIYVLLLDKHHFLGAVAELMKFRAGIALGVANIFIIGLFFLAIVAIFSNRIDRKTFFFVLPWFASAIPAVVIGLTARSDGLASSWQQSFIDFLTPSIYFWGCLVGRSWWEGRDYFIKRMSLVYCVTGALTFFGRFSMITAFAIDIIPICLCLAMYKSKFSFGWRLVGTTAGICGFAHMLFARMIAYSAKGRYVDAVDIGSTFTSMFVVVIGVGLALSLGVFITRRALRIVPWLAVLILSLVFMYAIARASTTKQSEVISTSDVKSWVERFEAKLIGDRGGAWRNAIENEVFIRPLVFKRIQKLYVTRLDPSTGQMVYTILMPPHNQVLTLLWRSGLWLGGTMIFFLFWIYGRAFKAASFLYSDRATLLILLCPFAGVFLAVGLTGQTVFSAGFCENAIASMFFPGVLYGSSLKARLDMRCSIGTKG